MGPPSLVAGTRSPSCLYLDNHLFIHPGGIINWYNSEIYLCYKTHPKPVPPAPRPIRRVIDPTQGNTYTAAIGITNELNLCSKCYKKQTGWHDDTVGCSWRWTRTDICPPSDTWIGHLDVRYFWKNWFRALFNFKVSLNMCL